MKPTIEASEDNLPQLGATDPGALLQGIPSAVYAALASEERQIVFMSGPIERILGYPPLLVTSDPSWWATAVHPEDLDPIQAAWARAVQNEDHFCQEYRVMAADGRFVWVRDEALLVREQRFEQGSWFGTMSDIDRERAAMERLELALEEERRSSAEIRRSDEMKTTFLTAVSHDIRTPLSAILGNAITLENGDRLGISEEERRQLVQSLAQKAKRLNEIVSDLLSAERLTRGVIDPKLQEIEVGKLIALLVWDSDLLAGRQVHVDVRSATGWVDPQMISRIVENLLANVAHHTPSESQVWVRVGRVNDHVEIVVEDDGPGIPEEFREVVFAPYEHGPETTAHNPGLGLGLALVARFAELHGGRAWVDERAGGGASFHVELPAGDLEGPPGRSDLP